MKEKTLALSICVMIAMSISGFAYAQWNDIIVVSNTLTFGNEEIGFVYPLTCAEYHRDPVTGGLEQGEYLGKEVGEYECDYTGLIDTVIPEAYEKLIIHINKAYPSYEVHCNFTLMNVGTLTVQISSVTVTDPDGKLTWQQDPSDLTHYEGIDIRGLVVINLYLYKESTGEPLEGITLDPDATEPCELIIEIKQDAEECHKYAFQVEIMSEV